MRFRVLSTFLSSSSNVLKSQSLFLKPGEFVVSGELSGMHTDMTSRAEVQMIAPFLINCKHPDPLGSQGADGVASNGRLKRFAHFAVESAPDR